MREKIAETLGQLRVLEYKGQWMTVEAGLIIANEIMLKGDLCVMPLEDGEDGRTLIYRKHEEMAVALFVAAFRIVGRVLV